MHSYEKTISHSKPEFSPEYIAYQGLFKEIYPQAELLFETGGHTWVDICAAISVPERDNRKESMMFIHDCQYRLRCIIRDDDYAIYKETSEIDGLVYLIFENADIDCLRIEAEDIIMDLSEIAEYPKEHITEIIQNIHRIRPETKVFLSIE